jgi:hypothetical protein
VFAGWLILGQHLAVTGYVAVINSGTTVDGPTG